MTTNGASLVFPWHEIGFVWVLLGEPAGKFSPSFVRKGGGGVSFMHNGLSQGGLELSIN